MDNSPFDSPSYWDLGHPVSPNPYRHTRDFSDASLLSASSFTSDINLNVPSSVLSRTNSHRKPPKQRLTKLIKTSLKHTLKSNNAETNNIDFWNAFYTKLRRILSAFRNELAVYEALNDPYSGKSSNKTSSSVIHILCKQFYLYSRSNNWSVCFKIWDSINYIIERGANTSLYYTKINEIPQKNYNSIHTLYQGLNIMLSSEVITNEQFVNYFSRAISAGNQDVHNEFVHTLLFEAETEEEKYANSILSESLTSLPSISTTSSNDREREEEKEDLLPFNPAVLTLCVYSRDIDDYWEWQNITYWMGDCLYHDYYVNLISPYLAKGFIMMGYDLLNISLQKLNHLDFNSKDDIYHLITDSIEINKVFNDHDTDNNIDDDDDDDMDSSDYDEDDMYNHKIHNKVIAFLWFIRFGNFMSDLINIIDIGIKQLALDQFTVDISIIEEIVSYSHYFVASSSNFQDLNDNNNDNMDKLSLSYFDEDRWMVTAFETLFKLNNDWIDWIGQYVMPQLSKVQTNKIKKNLSQNTSDKQWNRFIRRISLKSIDSFCKHDIFGVIDTQKMQNIVNKNYRNNELIPILMNAHYDIEHTFGNSSILYNILDDDTMDNIQIDNILKAIHFRIQQIKNENHDKKHSSNSAKLIINDLLFGVIEWKINQSIWKNIKLAFHVKYKYFRNALNELLYELTTEQHHEKFIFFMKNDMIDFNYCLTEDLIETALQSLIYERPFDKKASCIQIIGDWIYTNFKKETNDIRKKEIAQKAITAITSNMSDILLSNDTKHQDRDQVIIEQYLDQLKIGLSR